MSIQSARATLTLFLCAGLGLGALAGCEKEKGLRITDIEPKSGSPLGSSNVTISGSGFEEGGAKGATVYFGDKKAKVIKWMGDSQLVVQPPPGAEGEIVDVEIIFDDARRHVYEDAYTYADINEGFGVEALAPDEAGEAPPPSEAPAGE